MGLFLVDVVGVGFGLGLNLVIIRINYDQILQHGRTLPREPRSPARPVSPERLGPFASLANTRPGHGPAFGMDWPPHVQS